MNQAVFPNFRHSQTVFTVSGIHIPLALVLTIFFRSAPFLYLNAFIFEKKLQVVIVMFFPVHIKIHTWLFLRGTCIYHRQSPCLRQWRAYLTLGNDKLKPGRDVKRRGQCPETFFREDG